MIGLCCTANYRDIASIPDQLGPAPPPDAALGNWYANTFNVRRERYLLYTSEVSLLTVITPLRERSTAVERFVAAVAESLLGLGVPPNRVAAEISSMRPLVFARTSSRSVLGSMRDMAASATHILDRRGATLAEAVASLAKMPCGPIGYAHPAKVANELLASRWRDA